MTEVNDIIQPAVFRAKDAAAYLGMGTTSFYDLINRGKIRQGLFFSRRCRVWRRQWLDDFLDKMEQEQAEQE